MELLRAERRRLKGIAVGLVASIAAVAMAAGAGQASAATPVLAFAPSGGAFPVGFEAAGGEVTAAMDGIDSVVHCEESEGFGQITGPRSAEGTYWFYGCETQEGSEAGRKCSSAGADEGEIESENIPASLAFISQAKHEVGMVLAPAGGVYMTFDCEGIAVTAYGPFVSPVGPVNQLTSSFTADLVSTGASQAPSSYESDAGEAIPAVPTGMWGGGEKHATGVSLAFAVTTFSTTPPFPDLALEIKARTAAEVEAEERQRAEAEAAARRRQEEDAARAAAAKRQQEEAAAAEAKKRAEEEAKAKAEQGAKKPPTRAERLQKALKQCRKLDSKEKRANCVQRAKNRYGAHNKGKHKGAHKGKGTHKAARH